MNPKVSVVLTVFNTGEILKSTIESILNQTYKNFELLIINDGSEDDSLKICNFYAKRDERVKVFSKDNGGVCSARNLGILRATGEYITFCDHDDLYDKDILRQEIQQIEIYHNADLVIVGAKHIYDDGNILCFGEDIACCNKESILKNAIRILKHETLGTIWNVLYKREIIGNTLFDEELKKGHEDIIFNLRILTKANSLISIRLPLYYHYIRKSMSTSASYHVESLNALIKANNCIYEYIKGNVKDYDKLDYIRLQGEYIRTFATYSVHLGNEFNEFIVGLSKLLYIPENIGFMTVVTTHDKDVLSFYCLRQKHLWLLYFIIKVKNSLKGK